MRTWIAVAAAAGAGLAAGGARGEDAMALLKKVENRMYYPQDQGLKDLSATIEMAGGGAGGMSGMAIKVLWKAPDKKACRVELPEELKNSPMAGMMQGNIEKSMEGIVRVLVPERMSARQDDYEYAAEADGDLSKITGKRKADVKDKNSPEEIVMWVDAKATPVKMANTVNGQRMEMANLKFEEKGGKLLLAGLEVSGGPQKASMSLEYKEVESLWLVSAVKMGGQAGGGGMTIKEHVVNKGLDDALFVPKPAPAGGTGFPGAGGVRRRRGADKPADGGGEEK